MTILDTIRAFFSGSDQERTVVSGARCSSPFGERKRHLYEGGPVCVRCHAKNVKYVEPPLADLLQQAREVQVSRGPFINVNRPVDGILGEFPAVSREQISR